MSAGNMLATIIPPDLTSMEKVYSRAIMVLDAAKSITVKDDDTAAEAKAVAVHIDCAWNDIEAERKRQVAPYNDMVKRVNEFSKKLQTPLDLARRNLKDKLLKYQQEKLRAAEDRRRREAAEAADAIIAGRELPPALERAVADEKIIRTRKSWRIEITDLAKVPREYLMLNESLVREKVVAGSLRDVPGLRIFQEEVPVL